MISLVTVALLQTCVTVLLVYLRIQSVNRSLINPPKGYKKKFITAFNKKQRSVNFRSWKIGSIRRELIKQVDNPSIFSNEGFTNILNPLNEDEVEGTRLIEQLKKNDKEISKDKTIYGFFHPYCNAGGGGEKVLWKAVETTLKHDPNNIVVIYTGDIDTTGEKIIENVIKRFDYNLDAKRIVFIFLKNRNLVDSATWPHLTLLGQALGSIVLTIEAILRCPPDIWCDTMGYPFGYPWVWHLIRAPIVTYTHYPVISSDMLKKLIISEPPTFKNKLKYYYWKLFMMYYRHIGNYITIATTNSTWTNAHISNIWDQCEPHVVYPPCSTEKLIQPSDHKLERANQAIVLAQFRPEKRHKLIIESFGKYLRYTKLDDPLKLILIGSTRSDQDRAYVAELHRIAKVEYKIPEEKFEIMTDLPYSEIKQMLWSSTYGINAMWNEHFGIAVVEYLAGGLIPIVHGSAGPLLDIVVDDVGFFFLDESDPDYEVKKEILGFGELKNVFDKVELLDDEEKVRLSELAIKIALDKFSDIIFDENWNKFVLNKLNKKDN